MLGPVLGLVATFASRRLLAEWLVGVLPKDGATFGTSSALVPAGTLFAIRLPARQASRADPATSLRPQ